MRQFNSVIFRVNGTVKRELKRLCILESLGILGSPDNNRQRVSPVDNQMISQPLIVVKHSRFTVRLEESSVVFVRLRDLG